MPALFTICEYKKVNNCSIKCNVYPGNGNAPIAVFVHGGALIFGTRKDMPEAAIEAFRKAGYWVVTIDYRLAPETKLPFIIDDVQDALEWVRGEGAKKFNYNAEKMIVLGESGGGYLALITGTFRNKPKVIVSFYGYGDLLGDWITKPSPYYCERPPVSLEEAQKLVKDTEHSEVQNFDRFTVYLRLRQTGTWTNVVSGFDIHTERDKIEKYCPILNITDDYPPTILLHGDKDTDVPYEQSVDMFDALNKKGLIAELVTYTGGGHAFIYNKEDLNVSGMIDKALDFIKSHL